MAYRGQSLVLGWYAFLAWNVVLFHGLAALVTPVPARWLAVAASVALAASFLIQIAVVARSHGLGVRTRSTRTAVNRRTGEVVSANGERGHGRRPGAATHAAR